MPIYTSYCTDVAVVLLLVTYQLWLSHVFITEQNRTFIFI